MSQFKTRFAPSPTGWLHIGSLRTALFAYLFAKKNNGIFLLRIEDTDRERYMEGGVENILHSLDWAKIKPDEGVALDANGQTNQIGDNGPYIQSQRLEIYHKYIQELIDHDKAYYCFCSKERLDQLRADQQANNQPTGYDGQCRNLSLADARVRVQAGEKYVVRMKMPQDGTTKFNDLIRGQVEFQNNLIDDQVLLKADGYPTYHLAVVVDDHLMKITHIIRGEEWLSSTPKHILLYQMFGWTPPEFAHLSLLINEKKQKLSKRHGDVSVHDYIDKGYLPEALINFVAFLGWNPGDEREMFSLEELTKEFDFNKVSKSAAVFNMAKLDWYNGQYIRNLNIDELTRRCLPFLVRAGLIDQKMEKDMDLNQQNWLKKAISLEKDRLSKLSDLPATLGFVFADQLDYEAELLIWKKSTRASAKENLLKLVEFLDNLTFNDWTEEKLTAKTGEWISQNSLSNGEILWPLRVALSGQKNSPGPLAIAEVLGQEKTLQRIKQAADKL